MNWLNGDDMDKTIVVDTDLSEEQLTKTQNFTSDILEDDCYCILHEPTTDPDDVSLIQFAEENNIYVIAENFIDSHDNQPNIADEYTYLGLKKDLKQMLINFWGYDLVDEFDDLLKPFNPYNIVSIEMDTTDPYEEDLVEFIKRNNIQYQIVSDNKGNFADVYKYTGTIGNLLEMLKRFWSDDPCLLYTSPSPRDKRQSRMPSSA